MNDLIHILGFRHRCKTTVYLDIKEAEIANLLIDVMKRFNVYAKAILTEKSSRGLPIEILSFGEDEKKCLEQIRAAANYISKHVSTKPVD